MQVNLCVKHFALFPTSLTLVEDREMIVSLEKMLPSRGGALIIRSGKERVRNIFCVKVVQLMESLGREYKYGIGTFVIYGAVGGRVCDQHQKIFN